MNDLGTSGNGDWVRAFLPIGVVGNDLFEPLGGGVLLLDRPFVWLVTARSVLRAADGNDVSTWVQKEGGSVLVNLQQGLAKAGLDWVHHPTGISACLFPADPSFAVKAFSESQCTRIRDLQPMQPAASLGCLYGLDAEHKAPPAVCDGVISAVQRATLTVYATAPLIPRNHGAPLLLASPYGGAVTLAGILVGNTMLSEPDPRVLPLRLSRAIGVDAVLDLIRGDAAEQQRRRATGKPDATPRQEG